MKGNAVYERASRFQIEAVMPRRTLLSSEQRARLFSIPTDPAEMARHYVLSTEDLGPHPDKAARDQPAGVRHPALRPAPSWPRAGACGIAARADACLYRASDRASTRPCSVITPAGRRRAANIRSSFRSYLRLRSFGFADWRSCLKAGADAAWATDRGEPIVRAMIAHLRANNVLLPTVAVLERIGLAGRARARKKVFEALADGLTAAEREALEKLLAIDPDLRCSRFAWLRDYSESPAPSNIVALLDRLEYARGLGIGRGHAGRIHPTASTAWSTKGRS